MVAHLTPLEHAVVASLCELWPEHADAIRAQLEKARVTLRENTGGGFVTTFEVPPGLPQMLPGMPTSDHVEIVGLEQGMGFHLASNAGRLDSLEGSSYGEDTSELDPERVSFRLVR